jgi:hypothetical protein
MIDGKRVVAWTPFGRERTVSILERYLTRDHERGLIDEYWLCLNTDPDQVDDLRYGYQLAAAKNSFIKAMDRPAGLPRLTPKQRNTGYFCRYMTDPDTVYVRFDDDIVYVHEDAVERLVRHKLQTPESVCSHPVMWNNSIISWFLQQAGIIPESYGKVGGPYCMDPVGWADGRFAIKIHNLLLDHIEAGTPERVFLYQDFPIPIGMQFSVSCFASLGSRYAALPAGPGVLEPDEEESWHTVHEPKRIGHPNYIVGNSLVSHYTFFPQQSAVVPTDILDRYRDLAEALDV